MLFFVRDREASGRLFSMTNMLKVLVLGTDSGAAEWYASCCSPVRSIYDVDTEARADVRQEARTPANVTEAMLRSLGVQ